MDQSTKQPNQNDIQDAAPRLLIKKITKDLFQSLLMELQRSLDFCVSQLHQTAPSKIIIDETFHDNPELVSYLKKHLQVPIETLIAPAGQEIDSNQLINFYAVLGAGLKITEQGQG